MKILAFLDSAPGGDWPPLLGLMAILVRHGHQVRAVCDQELAGAVAAAGCRAVELPGELALGPCLQPALAAMLAGERLPSPHDAGPLAAWGRRLAVAVCDLTVGFVPDLLLATLFCQEAALAAARHLSRPWGVVNPSFFFGDRSRCPLPEDFSRLGYLLYRHWLLPPLRQADLVLHATDPRFDGTGPLPSGHLYLGPLFWEAPGELPTVLTSPGPQWLLLSLSTSPQQDDQLILEQAALALAAMECRVLVTLASPARPLDPANLPANFSVHRYIPHSLVLPHCRLAISHGGHGLVMKALRHGVPQLLIPWGRDQAGVAARAAALGVARVLPPADLAGESLAEMVRNLIADSPCHDHVRKHSRRLARLRLLPNGLQGLQQLVGAGRHRR